MLVRNILFASLLTTTFLLTAVSTQAQTTDALFDSSTTIEANVSTVVPELSAATLTETGVDSEAITPEVAQNPFGVVGILKRSYIGVGGNIGLDGEETAIGEGGFAVVNKIGFTKNLSLHNAVIFDGGTTATVALTFGFPIEAPVIGKDIAIPFIGGGISLDTENDWEVDPLITAGVDVPLLASLTGTVRLNLNFNENDDTDLGLILGVGYNFSPF